MEHERPRVAVMSLGGTIAMTRGGAPSGAAPTADADALVASVPGLGDVAEVTAASLLNIPSASLDFEILLGSLQDLDSACDDGADGVVVTTGTDTLEEVAYLYHLLWRRPEPLVVTGAMRAADAAGADGPGNLLAAVTVAGDPHARERGCLVVMNDEVHAAQSVQKTDTASTAAFRSPGSGPLGRVHEGRVLLAPRTPRHLGLELQQVTHIPRVALLRVALGDDTVLLARAMEAYDGLVVEALGGGHVPAWWAEPLLDAARRLPVVLASRTGCGPLLSKTYGFVGSESQLLEGGAISAGSLNGLKARVLLSVALMTGADGGALRRLLETFQPDEARACTMSRTSGFRRGGHP